MISKLYFAFANFTMYSYYHDLLLDAIFCTDKRVWLYRAKEFRSIKKHTYIGGIADGRN